jgi:hypothetical protein
MTARTGDRGQNRNASGLRGRHGLNEAPVQQNEQAGATR